MYKLKAAKVNTIDEPVEAPLTQCQKLKRSLNRRPPPQTGGKTGEELKAEGK